METPSHPLTTDESDDCQSIRDAKKRCRREKAYQMIVCLIANTSVLGPAMGLGYSAVAPLGSSETGIMASEDQQSWIASITAIATPIGCLLSSVAMFRGRRFALISTSVVSATGWLVIYFSSDVGHILAGRAICGVAIGLASTPATVYAAEVAGPKLRGKVVTWTSLAIAVGILMVYTLGFIFQKNWRLVALLSGIVPVISIALVFLKLPESPMWLQASGRIAEAERELRKINGVPSSEVTSDDLLAKLSTCKRSGENEGKEEEDCSPKRRALSRENMMPLLVMIGYFFFQQFSGTFVVIYYAVDLTLGAGIQFDGNLAAVLIGITRLVGTVCVSYVCQRYGRRIPSIASGVGMTLFMGTLSIYVWSSSLGFRLNDSGVIPTVSILMYILTSTMGFMVIPFAMIGEIYPAKYKDVFSGLTTCLAYLFSFAAIKMYTGMSKAIDKHGVFLFYAAFSLAGTIFVALFLPETKGKTLREIEDLFSTNRKANKNKKKLTADGTNCERNCSKNIVEKESTAVTLSDEKVINS